MYVKVGLICASRPPLMMQEDLIIPHVCLRARANPVDCQHYTFYDFILNKARGKSGPLFSFDAHDDVRVLADASKEKDEVGCRRLAAADHQSHAGKVVERSWYNRFKHVSPSSSFVSRADTQIFPASRWEIYDPDKDYGSYVSAKGVVCTPLIFRKLHEQWVSIDDPLVIPHVQSRFSRLWCLVVAHALIQHLRPPPVPSPRAMLLKPGFLNVAQLVADAVPVNTVPRSSIKLGPINRSRLRSRATGFDGFERREIDSRLRTTAHKQDYDFCLTLMLIVQTKKTRVEQKSRGGVRKIEPSSRWSVKGAECHHALATNYPCANQLGPSKSQSISQKELPPCPPVVVILPPDVVKQRSARAPDRASPKLRAPKLNSIASARTPHPHPTTRCASLTSPATPASCHLTTVICCGPMTIYRFTPHKRGLTTTFRPCVADRLPAGLPSVSNHEVYISSCAVV